jgi:hypothetical protein
MLLVQWQIKNTARAATRAYAFGGTQAFCNHTTYSNAGCGGIIEQHSTAAATGAAPIAHYINDSSCPA